MNCHFDRTRTFLALALLGLLSAASPSFAQPAKPSPASKTPNATPPVADPTVKARERFTEGVRLVKKKAWQPAYEAFLEAWQLKQHPQIALNLGRVEMELGKHRGAIAHLQHWLDNNRPEDPDSVQARAWIAEAKKEVATLRITVQGSGVEVRIDGESVGTSPLPPEIYVEPGKHTVEVGDRASRDEVTAEYQAGSTSEVSLAPKTAPAPIVTPTNVPTLTAVVEAPPPGPRPELVRVGAVLGGVLLVSGAFFAAASVSKAQQVDGGTRGAQCYDGSGYHAWCNEYHAYRNDVAVFGNLSIGMFIGGALVGGATLLYALRILPPGSSPKKAAFLAVPVLSPSSGGLAMTGSF